MSRPARRDFLGCLAVPPFAAPLAEAAPVSSRVAVLDWALMETMLAIGRPPIAVVAGSDWNRSGLGPQLPPGVADLGLAQEINFELLASLRPDLIVMSPFVEHFEPVLRRIAPTWNLSVFERGATPLQHQYELTRTLAARLDRAGEAGRYLTGAEQTLDAIRRRLASRPQQPVLLLNFIDGRHARVYGGSGLYQNVLDRIGLVNAWTGQTNYWGYATVGIERLATATDLQLMVFEPIPPDALKTLASSPLWTQLPFVKAGRVSILPSVLMFGALPSALRVAHLLDEHLWRRA